MEAFSEIKCVVPVTGNTGTKKKAALTLELIDVESHSHFENYVGFSAPQLLLRNITCTLDCKPTSDLSRPLGLSLEEETLVETSL